MKLLTTTVELRRQLVLSSKFIHLSIGIVARFPPLTLAPRRAPDEDWRWHLELCAANEFAGEILPMKVYAVEDTRSPRRRVRESMQIGCAHGQQSTTLVLPSLTALPNRL